MIYQVLCAASAVLLVLGVRGEPRRLRNAFLLGSTLLFGALSVLWAASRDPWLTRALDRALPVALLAAALALAAALIGNGLLMARREGPSLANRLPLLTGGALACVCAIAVAADATGSAWLGAVSSSLLLVTGYVLFLVLSLLLYCAVYASPGGRRGLAAIVVLGAGLQGARVPPLLAGRIDRALGLYRANRDRGHPPLLVVSGGRGDDPGSPSEASAMREYLLRRGVPDEHIVLEDRATTTEENLRFSRALIDARGVTGRAVAVTNNFHVFRAAVLSRRLRLRLGIVGAPTAAYFLPSAFLREFAALLARHRLLNAAACLALAAAPPARLLLSG